MAFDLARLARMQALIEQLAPLEGKLLPNEREMLRHLRAKIAEPGQTDFDDAHVLEVILRNVRVREGYDIQADRDPGRIIEVGRKRSEP